MDNIAMDVSEDISQVLTTPVKTLSKEENKKSLSAKKKKGKSLRNILGVPADYIWPTIDDDGKNILFKSIQKVSFLKNSSENEHKSAIKFGLSETKRYINNRTCSAILFDTNIPKILISHLVDKCVENNIPIMCIPGLQHFIAENFGFKSISIVFMKTHLQDCNAIIQQIASHFDKSRNEISNKITQEQCTVENVNRILEQKTEKPENKTPISYLPNSGNRKRAFIPIGNDSPVKVTKTECDVIMLDNFKTINGNFKPLVIKKIQPNSKRKNKRNS